MTTAPVTRNRPRIAITTGDPNGIGPEVVLKCLGDVRLLRYVDPVIIGSPGALAYHQKHLGLQDTRLVEVNQADEEPGDGAVAVIDPDPGCIVDVEFGAVRAEGGSAAMRAVETAVRGCLDGTFDAMVTAPISKEAISLAGYAEPGHTEFIARLAGGRPLMMMVSDRIRVALVTTHIPLRAVPC